MSVIKMENIKNYLCSKFVEREEIVEAILLSVLANQHCLLIGSPGTAKSALVSEFAKLVKGGNYFQWLLSRFSTPEELFGPLSLKELEQGVYKRNTTHKLPEAHLAFLDEIFKANSAILNSLLTQINERLFYNNGTPVQTPLMSVIGASNEYPEEGEGLEALFDRFLLRFEVDYIHDDTNFISMLKGPQATEPEALTLIELQELQFYVAMVQIPDEVLEKLAEIRKKLKDEGVRPSDRRFRQSLSLLKAKAVLEKRDSVLIKDLLILKDALWETVDQRAKVHKVVKDHAQDAVSAKVEQVLEEVKEIMNNLGNSQDANEAKEANKKLMALQSELGKIEQQFTNRSADIQAAREMIQQYQNQIANIVLGI